MAGIPRGGARWASSLIGGGGRIHQPPILIGVSEAPANGDIDIVAAPRAPIASGDVSRRWALAAPDGVARFAGVTRPEGQAAAAAMADIDPGRWDRLLVQVTLAVVLSDGAGPYLLDARGRLTLVLGPHRGISHAHVTMGDAVPLHAIGLTRRLADGPVWEWVARADVPPAGPAEALDALDELTDSGGAGEWEGSLPGVGCGACPPTASGSARRPESPSGPTRPSACRRRWRRCPASRALTAPSRAPRPAT